MADITRDIGVDEHYIITSETAAAPTDQDALKGFAFGTAAGRILRPAELMTAKKPQPVTITNPRGVRDIIRTTPIVVPGFNPLQILAGMAVGAVDKMKKLAQGGMNLLSGSIIKASSFLKENLSDSKLINRNALLERQIIQINNLYQKAYREIGFLKAETEKLTMKIVSLQTENLKLKEWMLTGEQARVSRGYKKLSQQYPGTNKINFPAYNPYISFVEGKVDILHEEMKNMKQNTGRQLNIRNRRG
jgi:hypothetical protein